MCLYWQAAAAVTMTTRITVKKLGFPQNESQEREGGYENAEMREHKWPPLTPAGLSVASGGGCRNHFVVFCLAVQGSRPRLRREHHGNMCRW